MSRIEQNYFMKILQCHSKVALESIYLSIGVLPFRFHLMKRRITYYKVLLQRSEDEVTRKVVMAQKDNILPGDFYTHARSQ